MSDPPDNDDPIRSLPAGEADLEAVAKLTRIGRAITPDLRLDPRAALRDTRIRSCVRSFRKLRAVPACCCRMISPRTPMQTPTAAGSSGISAFSKSATDAVVLLQVEDWIANDGANVGAMDEMRDAFANRKVRIFAEKVQTPSRSLEKTMPRIWREKAKADVEFVSWRYVMELLERKLSPGQVFGLTIEAAPVSPNGPNGPGPIEKKVFKTVFISSTGLDLRAYREAARDVCMTLELVPIMMEHFEAMGLGATAGSKKKTRSGGPLRRHFCPSLWLHRARLPNQRHRDRVRPCGGTRYSPAMFCGRSGICVAAEQLGSRALHADARVQETNRRADPRKVHDNRQFSRSAAAGADAL